MLYKILQYTPFPNHFEPMPEWQLQTAEFALKLNKEYYYEHATKQGNVFLYPLEIAEQIIAYWQERWAFANYQLLQVENTPNIVCTGRGLRRSKSEVPGRKTPRR